MKKFTKVILIIAACCFGFGVLLAGIGFLLGARGFALTSGGKIIDYNSAEYVDKLDKTVINEEFDSIVMNCSLGDITIEESDDFYIEYTFTSYTGTNKATYSVEDGTLTFSTPDNKNVGWTWFNFSVPSNFVNGENYVKIYVPAGYKLELVDINANCGGIEIDLSEITECVIDSDLGEVEINNITSDTFDLTANCGDVKLDNCQLGNIEMKVDLGEIKVSDSTLTKGEVKNNCGDIKFESVTVEDLKVKDDLGSIKLELVGDISDYDYDFNTDLGTVKVNGEDRKTSAVRNESSKYSIEAKNNCGDVKVSFE